MNKIKSIFHDNFSIKYVSYIEGFNYICLINIFHSQTNKIN